MLPGGAALFVPGDRPGAWVLIDDGEVARLGGALAWAVRAGAVALDVVVDGSPVAGGIVARRAVCFREPSVNVWSVSGTSLVAAVPSLVDADPASSRASSPPADLVEVLLDAGLEVVWEHGVLRGEVLGLEVARTVGGRLEVGVGRHDRMARFEMRPSEPLSAALASAAEAVRARRRPGGAAHPAQSLARGRWLRSVLVASPGLVGLTSLRPVAPPLPWFDLPEAGAAPAVGISAVSGERVVVVCSVGVDLDLVPTAADCWLLYGSGGSEGCEGSEVSGGSEVWVVVPEGDDLPITRELALRCDPPVRVVTVPRGWESLGA